MTTLGPGEWLVRLPGPVSAAATPARPAVCGVASWAWMLSEQDSYDALGAPQPSG